MLKWQGNAIEAKQVICHRKSSIKNREKCRDILDPRGTRSSKPQMSFVSFVKGVLCMDASLSTSCISLPF